MKDILTDIIAHTNKLGFLNIVKISGTDNETVIDSISDNRDVVMYGKTATPCADLTGVFGMPQLEKLRYLLECKEYQDDATIKLIIETKDGEDVRKGLHFENKDGDFKNDYRFMNRDIISEKVKSLEFEVPKWDVVVSPSVVAIQRFQLQAGANPEHTTFFAKTEDKKLKFTFGDVVSHGGEFVFATDVVGKLDREHPWPVAPILSILRIADTNNTVLSFSNDGALQVTLDSGIATYQYIILAQV